MAEKVERLRSREPSAVGGRQGRGLLSVRFVAPFDCADPESAMQYLKNYSVVANAKPVFMRVRQPFGVIERIRL
jgi:hypothetical protein